MENVVFRTLLGITLAACFILLPPAVFAVEPVRHMGVYVLPYYEAAPSPEDRPRVSVGDAYDELLSSTRAEDIIAVRDLILREPQLVSPTTLMVLAIRLYDVGLRDDSVFWFYVAKDRYITAEDVLDMRDPGLAQVAQAIRSFASLAGPIFNGYAFCDLDKQSALRMKALDWVIANPYQAVFLPHLPARPGDRTALLERAVESLRQAAQKEDAHLSQPDVRAEFAEQRRRRNVDRLYCWQ
jgi:hypothetical protein